MRKLLGRDGLISSEAVIQSIVAFAVISAAYRLMYGKELAASILYSAGIIVCYWLGRLIVRFLNRNDNGR